MRQKEEPRNSLPRGSLKSLAGLLHSLHLSESSYICFMSNIHDFYLYLVGRVENELLLHILICGNLDDQRTLWNCTECPLSQLPSRFWYMHNWYSYWLSALIIPFLCQNILVKSLNMTLCDSPWLHRAEGWALVKRALESQRMGRGWAEVWKDGCLGQRQASPWVH